MGYVEPLSDNEVVFRNQFENKLVGTAIPNEYIPAIERAFYEAALKGPFTGYPIVNLKFVLENGVTHVVDSNSNAFATATKYALQQGF